MPNLCMVTEALPFSLHSVVHGNMGVSLDRQKIVSISQDICRYLFGSRCLAKGTCICKILGLTWAISCTTGAAGSSALVYVHMTDVTSIKQPTPPFAAGQ